MATFAFRQIATKGFNPPVWHELFPKTFFVFQDFFTSGDLYACGSNAHETPMSIYEPLLSGYFTQEEAATELKVSPRTIDRWRRLDEGPPITKLGRRTLYRRSSLQAWLCEREHRGHGGDGAGEKSKARKCQ
jgi:hypothetical protein